VSLSLVDNTHPATAQPFQDAVLRDDLADHCAEISGSQVMQVNES
jgi:hypothetical protein